MKWTVRKFLPKKVEDALDSMAGTNPKDDELGEDESDYASAMESDTSSKGNRNKKINDGIITKDGKVIEVDKDDFMYAMKEGGPLGQVFSKGFAEQMSLLQKSAQAEHIQGNKQIKLLEANNMLMSELIEVLASKPNGVNVNNVSKSSVQQSDLNNSLMGVRAKYAV